MRTGRPEKSEAAAFYWKYIDKIEGDDPVEALEQQLAEATKLFAGISEEKSTYRYAPEKWSVRQSLNHLTDTEADVHWIPSAVVWRRFYGPTG